MSRLPCLLALVGLAPLLGSTGCDVSGDLACTEIGCSNAYSIGLVAADRFPDGVYDIETTSEGSTEACRFEVADGRVAEDGICNAGYAVGASFPSPETVGVSVSLYTSEVRIVVSRDGTVLEDLTTTPIYETVQPNGPDCGPVCRVASTEIQIGAAP